MGSKKGRPIKFEEVLRSELKAKEDLFHVMNPPPRIDDLVKDKRLDHIIENGERIGWSYPRTFIWVIDVTRQALLGSDIAELWRWKEAEYRKFRDLAQSANRLAEHWRESQRFEDDEWRTIQRLNLTTPLSKKSTWAAGHVQMYEQDGERFREASENAMKEAQLLLREHGHIGRQRASKANKDARVYNKFRELLIREMLKRFGTPHCETVDWLTDIAFHDVAGSAADVYKAMKRRGTAGNSPSKVD